MPLSNFAVFAAGLVLLAAPVAPSGSVVAAASRKSVRNQRVRGYRDSAHDVAIAMDHASATLAFPIGFELIEQLPNEAVSIEVSDGTVADVISAIMDHAPGYRWVEQNGVVNVIPKQNTDSLLDTKIRHFAVHNSTPPYIHRAIASLPEIKAWLSRSGVTESSIVSGSILIGADGKTDEPRVSLDRRNETLRTIMNALITRKGGPRSWSFSRYGDSNQYLSISVD